MKKTILTLALMLMMALAATAGPAIKATPASKTHVALKGDSIVVTDGKDAVTISGLDLQMAKEDALNYGLSVTLISVSTGQSWKARPLMIDTLAGRCTAVSTGQRTVPLARLMRALTF